MGAWIAVAAAHSFPPERKAAYRNNLQLSNQKTLTMNSTPIATEIITISGMSCGHCVVAVRQALQEIAGLDLQEVAIGSAHIQRDPEQVSDQQIVDAIEDAGYTVSSINQEAAH